MFYFLPEFLLYISSFFFFFIFLINFKLHLFTQNQIYNFFLFFVFIVGLILLKQIFLMHSSKIFYINSLYLHTEGLLILKFLIIFFSLFYFLFISRITLIYINLEIFFFLLCNFLLALFGIMCSNNIFLIFIFLEFQTFITIILISSFRYKKISINSVFLYFILTSILTIYFLFSLLIIYGYFRTFNLSEISLLLYYCDLWTIHLKWIPISFMLIFINLLFKIASVPFHFWIKDVYLGVTLPLLGFLTTINKIPIFYLILKLFFLFNIFQNYTNIAYLLMFSGMLSLIYGTFLTLQQTTIKSFLICSSITHTGFLLIILVFVQDKFYLVNFLGYLINYVITLLIIWIILTYIYDFSIRDDFSFNKLSIYLKYNFKFNLIFCFCLVSLGGLPPFLGFFFKFNIFLALFIDQQYILLILGTFISVITLYYYLKVIKYVFFDNLYNLIKYNLKLKFSIKDKDYFFIINVITLIFIILFYLIYKFIFIISFIISFLII